MYHPHSEEGHEWIVFNRLPDRIPSNPDDGSHMSDSDGTVGFSETEDNAENDTAEVADTTSGSQNLNEMEEEDKNNNQDCTHASGASSEKFTSADLTAGHHSITVSNSSSELSLVSRDERHIRCKKNVSKKNKAQKKNKRPTKTAIPDSVSISDQDQAEISEDILEESNQGIDSSKPCKFNKIVYRDNVNGKTTVSDTSGLINLIGDYY